MANFWQLRQSFLAIVGMEKVVFLTFSKLCLSCLGRVWALFLVFKGPLFIAFIVCIKFKVSSWLYSCLWRPSTTLRNLKTKNNAQTIPKQPQNNFEKVQNTTFSTPNIAKNYTSNRSKWQKCKPKISMFGVIYGPSELKIRWKVSSLTLKSMPKLILNNFGNFQNYAKNHQKRQKRRFWRFSRKKRPHPLRLFWRGRGGG